MAIEQYLTNISVDGGPPGIAFGGYIFSAKTETGFTSSPSKCILRILLKDSPNITEPPTPSLQRNYILSINNYYFFAYMLESTIEKSVGETVLNIVFCDMSVKLDRLVVGLTGRAAEEPGQYGNLCVLGQEVAPKSSDEKIKCLDCEAKIIEVDQNYPITSACQDRDVYYTGKDFVSGVLGSLGGDVDLLNSDHHFSHVGNAREVLNSICSDLGLTWYWDWTTNKVMVISSGVILPNIDLKKSTIVSYSKTSSKEGTFASNSNTYSVTNEEIISQSIENYHQVVLRYVGDPTVSEDVICGSLAQISKDLRDDYCYGRGMWHRLGFGGTVGAGGFQFLDNKKIQAAAEALGDQALWDISRTYDRWYEAVVNPELRSYWEAREAGALQNYGKKYRVAEGMIPMVTQKKCEGDFSIDISYDRYPDFDNAGNWTKQTSPSSPKSGEENAYQSRYPAIVIPIVGQLADVYGKIINFRPMGRARISNPSPITNTNAFSSFSLNRSSSTNNNNPGLSMIGWAGAPYGNYFGNSGNCINPEEEPLTYINDGKDQDCAIGCEKEKAQDVCQKLVSACSNHGQSITQGMPDRSAWCYSGFILPSIGPFHGWIKKTQQARRAVRNPKKITNGSMPDGDVKENRYQSIDITKGDGFSTSGAFYDMAKTLTVEYAGVETIPIIGGLTSISYIIDSNGAFTSVTYNSRPQESPKPDPVLGKVIVKKLAW